MLRKKGTTRNNSEQMWKVKLLILFAYFLFFGTHTAHFNDLLFKSRYCSFSISCEAHKYIPTILLNIIKIRNYPQ